MKLDLNTRVEAFHKMIGDFLIPGKLVSQYAISLIEDFSLTIDELPDFGRDFTEPVVVETWASISETCRQLLEAFEPKNKEDGDALNCIYMDASTIHKLAERDHKKFLKESA